MALSAAALSSSAHTHDGDHAPATFDSLELRRAFSQFPQGIVVVAAEVDGAPEGLVASTFTVGISLEPALVTFAVQHSSTTWPRLRDGASHLGVSVLGAEQAGLGRKIAAKDRDSRFAGVEYTTDDDGAVIIPDVPLWLTTRIYNQFPAGDHDVVVLEVLNLGLDESAPGLVFHRSEFTPLPETS